MIKNAVDLDDFKVIVDLFEDFNKNFKDFLKTGNCKEIVDDFIISTFKDDIMDLDGVEAVIQEINAKQRYEKEKIDYHRSVLVR